MLKETASFGRRMLKRSPKALAIWVLVVTLFGSIAVPWTHPKMTPAMVAVCETVVRPGDILGVGTDRYLTGRCLPGGKYRVEHSAVYVGNQEIVEAVTPVVHRISLQDFLKTYDRVVVLSPPETCDREAVCRKALEFVGREYDALFERGTDRLYCHETCTECLRAGGVDVRSFGDIVLFDDFLSYCTVVYVSDGSASGSPAAGHIFGSEPRSPRWSSVRKTYLSQHTVCEVCCRKPATQVHHVKPFHLWPELELDPSNLIAVCDECHIAFCHLGRWDSFNPLVREESKRHASEMANRPLTQADGKKFESQFKQNER